MTKVMDAESAPRNSPQFIFELKFTPFCVSRFRALYLSNISLVYLKKELFLVGSSVVLSVEHKNTGFLTRVENNLCV